jgi:hypothetical protein
MGIFCCQRKGAEQKLYPLTFFYSYQPMKWWRCAARFSTRYINNSSPQTKDDIVTDNNDDILKHLICGLTGGAGTEHAGYYVGLLCRGRTGGEQ